MKNIQIQKITGRICILVMTAFLLFGCNQDPVLWKINSEQQVIADYITSNPDQYSEFGKLLEATGLNPLLSVRGPFTLFLPTNDAMKAYYKEKNVNSFEDFTDPNFKYKLVKNHLVVAEIGISDISLGALRDTNAIGDYLVTEFQGSDIIINKKSKIIKRDILAANGYIQQIDKVIEPISTNIFDQIASDPSYSMFAEGLKRTGLKDTLQLISFPYGKKTARTRFTLLAVADTTFKRYGINNIDQLVAHFTNSPDSITYLKNPFYRYMEYHCLAGTYYLSSFTSKLYPILSSDNNILVTIDTDYKLNFDRKTSKYTGFNIDQSNIPTKNGAIHTINDLLPVIVPDPSVIIFEPTDYFDMRQGDYFGKYYMKWFDGQNTFKYIKWEGDYLQYYYKNHDTGELLNWDCLNMNGFWWIEITTPKIMKGHYNLTGNIWSGIDYEVWVDGVKTKNVVRADPAKSTSFGEFTWNVTEQHKIKLVSTTWSTLFWDTVIFTPIP